MATRLPGFFQRAPGEDVNLLPKILLRQAQEIKDEIDALWRERGNQKRADAPWESDQELAELEKSKIG